MTEASPNEGGQKVSQEGKKSFDLSGLITDSHLSKPERDIIVDSYQKDKERLFQATKNELKSFILRDYGAANMQSLGGFDGVVALQKALKVDPADGSFGPDTFKALIEYQKNNNLTIDGIAGTETMGKLGITKASNIKNKSLNKINKKPGNDPLKRGSEKSTKEDSMDPPTSIEEVSIASTISMAPVIKKFTTFTNGIEEQIKSINDHKKENTTIVAGVGDWIGEKTGAYETGKSIYEQQIKQAQDRAKELHSQIITQFQGKNIPETEMIEIGKLIARLEKLAGAKLEEVSWGKAVFNTIGAGDIEGDAGSLKNRTKIFAKTTIGIAEGAYDVFSSIAEITGKAIGITAAYVGSSVSEGKIDSSVGKQIASDVREIFSMLTIENAKIAIAKLPEALEKFANASPDVQAEGFGKFFGSLLVAGGVGVKVFQGGKHAVQLGNRAIRMANHKGLSKSAPLALAGAVQLGSGTAAIGTGVALRMGEMDVIPAKKGVKKSSKNIELEAKKSGEISHGSADKSVGGEQKSGNAEGINDMGKLLRSFEVDGVDSRKLYKRMAMYYHPDRNAHPQAKEIFQEMKDAFERGDRKKLEAIAKDPDGFLKSKNPTEHVGMTPHEKFMDGLKKYQDQFSESYLRGLAEKDQYAFGEALLHKHTLEEFATLAKTDPDRALAEFNSFMKNPNEYFAKKFPSPYITVDSEIRNYARQAYEGKYKAEGEKLIINNRQAYEEYLRKNPEVKGNIEQIMSGLEEVGKLLDGKFTTLAKQMREITNLLKGDIREKWGLVNSKLESFIESIRLEPGIGLKMKADISQRIRSLREKYFTKVEKESPDIPQNNPHNERGFDEHKSAKPEARKYRDDELQPFDHTTIKMNELSSQASRIFENGYLLKPEYKIQIDGVDFLLTGKIKSRGRDYVLGAVKVNGKYEPRFFYFSKSGGNWHCAPGIEAKGRYSKAEFLGVSYEKGTVVSPKLSESFTSLKTHSISGDIADMWKQGVGDLDDAHFKGRYGHEFSVDKIDGNSPEHIIKLGKRASADKVINAFRDISLPSGLNQSFPGGFKKGPTQIHDHLGPVDTVIGKTTLNGSPIEVVFATTKDRPDLVWVEDIRFMDAKINSHGIPDRTANAGMLTAKPLEYSDQIPNSINPIHTGEGKIYASYLDKDGNKQGYVDIRPYMQENPLIMQFKRLNGMRQAA